MVSVKLLNIPAKSLKDRSLITWVSALWVGAGIVGGGGIEEGSGTEVVVDCGSVGAADRGSGGDRGGAGGGGGGGGVGVNIELFEISFLV